MGKNKVHEHLGFHRWWGNILTVVVIVSLSLLLVEFRVGGLQIAITIMFTVSLGFLVVTWFAAEIIFDQANHRTRASEEQVAHWAERAYVWIYFDSVLTRVYYRAMRWPGNKKARNDLVNLEEARRVLGSILEFTDPKRLEYWREKATPKLGAVAITAEADRQRKREPK